MAYGLLLAFHFSAYDDLERYTTFNSLASWSFTKVRLVYLACNIVVWKGAPHVLGLQYSGLERYASCTWLAI